MKKNVLVILVVIAVFGVVIYLLKDRLKTLLGERAEGEEIPGEIETKKGISLPGIVGWLGLKRYVPGGVTMDAAVAPKWTEPPARWLREEIAPVLQPLYPARYIPITKGLLAYLTIGEAALPPVGQEPGIGPLIELKQFKTPEGGPYSWALPQF